MGNQWGDITFASPQPKCWGDVSPHPPIIAAPGVSVRVRVSLGFRDRVRVRVKVRVSFRLATFMYSVWPPVSVRVSLGFRVRV